MITSATRPLADPPPDRHGRVAALNATGRGGSCAAETMVTSCDGHTFVLRRTGTGSPVLLLHDMGKSQRDWDAVAPLLSATHAVYTWDARGHGVSRGTPEAGVPTLSLLAADLAAAIAACSPDPPVLVGHALGALTILEYVRNHGGRDVARVVLVDQTPRMLTSTDWPLGLFGDFGAGDACDLETRIRDDFAETWLKLHARGLNARARAEYEAHSRVEAHRNELRRLAGGSMLMLWRSQVSRDYRVDLATLPVPLLVVLGAESNLYDTERLARWIVANAPGARIARYENADHSPHAAAPARFARDIAEFAAGNAHVVPHRKPTVAVSHVSVSVPARVERPLTAGVAA